MLVLSRKRNEKIVVMTPNGEEIVFCVLEIRADRVRIGVEAPKDHAIHREEIIQAIRAEKTAGAV
jgi:carbon storage regulator